MKCPNCGRPMDTYFLSTSHLDHGCFRCGCIVDWEDGHIVGYKDDLAYGWTQATGRRLKPSKVDSSEELSDVSKPDELDEELDFVEALMAFEDKTGVQINDDTAEAILQSLRSRQLAQARDLLLRCRALSETPDIENMVDRFLERWVCEH